MNPSFSTASRSPLSIVAVALAALLGGAGPAAAVDHFGPAVDTARAVENDPDRAAHDLAKGPKQPPVAAQAAFDGALACMDRLFGTYGIHDVSVVLTDIPDGTGKVKAGTREMFMSATSRMTRRSRAIRLVPYQDNAVFEGRRDVLLRSRYSLQGSVTQLDESIVKRQRDGAICLGPFCLGVASSDSYNALGLDLNLIRNSDLSMLPGVSSSNSVLVVKHGAGANGELNINKFGLNFNMTYTTSEGNGQAVRALVDLGTVELFGKLLKIPYWSCLGQDQSNADVVSEVEDWWEQLAANPQELVGWLQVQMKARHLYGGEPDGAASPALLQAVAAYKEALGLPGDTRIDASFLRAYLAADHAALEKHAQELLAARQAAAIQVQAQAQAAPSSPAAPATPTAPAAPAAPPAPAAPTAPATPAAPAATPGPVAIVDHHGARAGYQPGEVYELDVTSPRDGWLYCWLIDAHDQLVQFFPRPEAPALRTVRAHQPIAFPGQLDLQFYAAEQHGQQETVACGVSPRDLGAAPLDPPGATPLDLAGLQARFVKAAGADVNFGAYHVVVQ